MKTLTYVFLTICFCSTLHAQKSGTIYFMRLTGISGTVSAFNAFIDGELVCRLNNKKFSVHEVPAGEHTITVQFSGKNAKEKAEPITVTVEPGQPVFVQMVLEVRAIINNLYCQEITESSARPVLRKLKEDTKCR
ncbi:DUF2846 domain-containing protein [Phaeodactylibacter sp.]|uniref:DUF2846 domain-containing protein n=1 Tax=Phaeodactylibacter sp. TaxID=1940289 RepID=UPI0025D0B22B|nr:DUF2846 domain-containing protein [Phaeodactylibacter sp.]MCI4647379.1 DUF2846 domain-containing protein [Phaeodactylibacter sp.]MCI5094150.1 DUF2846 domain-containing protein [Phaeodactylibacter sp.]